MRRRRDVGPNDRVASDLTITHTYGLFILLPSFLFYFMLYFADATPSHSSKNNLVLDLRRKLLYMLLAVTVFAKFVAKKYIFMLLLNEVGGIGS